MATGLAIATLTIVVALLAADIALARAIRGLAARPPDRRNGELENGEARATVAEWGRARTR